MLLFFTTLLRIVKLLKSIDKQVLLILAPGWREIIYNIRD